MRQYCLNKEELSRFIDIEIDGGLLDEDEYTLKVILDDWQSWDVEIVCLATLFSHILERKRKKSIDAFLLIEKLYKLPEEKGLGFIVEQIDEVFIDYMLKHVRRADLSIEEELIEIRHQFGEYNFTVVK